MAKEKDDSSKKLKGKVRRSPEQPRMPQPKQGKYSGVYTKDDFKEWIDKAEAGFDKVRKWYEEDRDYLENAQAPENIPEDKDYIVENRLLDLNRRLCGQIISGRINPTLKGGGEMMVPAYELFEDILEKNKFKEQHVPNFTNHIYCEGYCGLKFRYNPYKECDYGIGKPEIFSTSPEYLWLDPDAKDLMHVDDVFRIAPSRILLSEAKKRWPEFADQIHDSNEDYRQENDQQANRYADLYEIEFRETHFYEKQNEKGSIKLERDKYYIVKVINRTVIVEGPEETGYPLFRLIPMMHTPRKSATFGKMPFGPNRLLGQTQDQLNITASILTETAKQSVKNLFFVPGAKDEEITDMEQKSTQPMAFIPIRIGTKVQQMAKSDLSIAYVQLYEMINHRFDRMQGDFGPSRGELKGNLAGVTVHQLVSQGILSEYVAQANIETALTDLARCILHCMKNEMNTPFMITRKIDGEDKKIGYNVDYQMTDNFQGDNYHVVDSKFGKINDLSQINMDVSIEIEMNHEMKRQADIQLAIMAHDRGKLSDEDFLKALFPKTWQQKLKNLQEQNQAMTLVKEIAELGPEAIQYVQNVVGQIKPKIQELEEARKTGKMPPNLQGLDIPA